jgi:hypothetical protein
MGSRAEESVAKCVADTDDRTEVVADWLRE